MRTAMGDDKRPQRRRDDGKERREKSEGRRRHPRSAAADFVAVGP
jgi:hypothetical protein